MVHSLSTSTPNSNQRIKITNKRCSCF